MDDALADERLMNRPDAFGKTPLREGGMIELTRAVLERPGSRYDRTPCYEKHDPAGRDSGDSRDCSYGEPCCLQSQSLGVGRRAAYAMDLDWLA